MLYNDELKTFINNDLPSLKEFKLYAEDLQSFKNNNLPLLK
jgi:hypothetical protein